jgi:transposase
MDRDSLAVLLSQGLSVEKIGKRFGKDPSTVSYWMKKFGLEAPNRTKHAAKGGIEREELERLVGAGLSIAQIASAVGLSKGTVRHWLCRYGLTTKTAHQIRREQVVGPAREAGLLTVSMECRYHGETEFILEGRGYYRCKRCRTGSVIKRRRRVKAILVGEAGGRCVLCGYDEHIAALEFHHLDPAQKRLAISYNGASLSLETLRAEARKCVLLCSNCHAALEAGAVKLPIK